MPSTLNLTTTVIGDNYVITGGITPGGTLPTGVFIYVNNGDGTLGEFFGTCSLSELGRLQFATPGVPIPTFGNKYVRSDQVKITVPLGDSTNTASAAITALVKNVTTLSKAYEAQVTTSASYIIP